MRRARLTVTTAEGAPLDFVECAHEDIGLMRARLLHLYAAWGAAYVVNAWGQRV